MKSKDSTHIGDILFSVVVTDHQQLSFLRVFIDHLDFNVEATVEEQVKLEVLAVYRYRQPLPGMMFSFCIV